MFFSFAYEESTFVIRLDQLAAVQEFPPTDETEQTTYVYLKGEDKPFPTSEPQEVLLRRWQDLIAPADTGNPPGNEPVNGECDVVLTGG